ncbi:MAG: amidase [Candidatus Marinimicrobia bacterium]|nr:amidase [Candidatus Neomarinimicrobiota bacterium]
MLKQNHLTRTVLFAPILLWIFLSACRPDVPAEDRRYLPFPETEISGIRARYADGSLSAEALVREYLQRIKTVDETGPAIRALITVNPDAIRIAKVLDREMKEGRIRGPLHGIPVVLKDNIDTQDRMPATAGSRALKDSYPLQDSFVASQLREAGAVILGKANLSEWANFRGELSSSGWSGVGGQTKNPYALRRNPCGSSSGSAAAVSANLTMLAIGTETNGSIVCPAHANGIVGIKPTVGLISRSGIIPISRTQDTAGPMARTVRDAAICLGVLTAVDPQDEKTQQAGRRAHTDYTQFLKREGLQGKRIGYYTAFRGINFKVDALMDSAVAFMKTQGATVIEVDDILAEGTEDRSFEVMLFEYKEGLNDYFSSLGPKAPVKDLADLIAFNRVDPVELEFYNQKYLEMAQEKDGLDSETYREALRSMLEGSREQGIDRVMNEHELDALIAPTGTPAWFTDPVNGDSFQFGSSSSAAISGYPNITVPMGFIGELPVGISIFGRAWSEPVLLEIAFAYEQGTQHRRAPRFLEDY